MKIYFIGQKGIPVTSGGIEKHVQEVSTRLASLGHQVYVYVRPWYTDKELKEYEGVNLISLPSLKTKHLDAISHTFLSTFHVLFKKVDIVHYHGIGPSMLLWIVRLLKPKTKVISTFHSDDTKHQKWSNFAKFMLTIGAFISVKLSHRSIAVSKDQRDSQSKKFNGNMTYLPNGVYVPQNVEPKLITEKWGLEGNDYILAVSRLIRHKGIQYLIRAYAGLKDNKGKKLVIVGDGSYTDDYVKYLKDLAGDNPNIIFTGEQKGRTLKELFSNAYMFVQPSEYEGLSIALLEAMSYGLPMIVSDIPANLEAVDNIGLSFRNKDISDLYDKLKYLLENPNVCEIMKKNLVERVCTEYNWDIIVGKLEMVYDEVLNEGKEMAVKIRWDRML